MTASDAISEETDALVLLDLATKFKMCVPVSCKDATETEHAIRRFVGSQPVKLIYSDNAPNIKRAAADMGLVAEFSLPGVPKNNSKAERAVQDVLQGTRVFLLQAGLPTCFWPMAASCYRFSCNVFEEFAPKTEDSVTAGGIDIPQSSSNSKIEGRTGSAASTAFKKRYGRDVEINPLAIEFGAGVWYMPAPTKTSLPKLEPRLRYGVFLGYEVEPGGKWAKKYVVGDLEDFIGKSLRADTRKQEFPNFSPHITAVVRLPTLANSVKFPLKERYNFFNNTLDGLEAVEGLQEADVKPPEEVFEVSPDGDVKPGGPDALKRTELAEGFFYQARADGAMRLMGPDGYEYRSNSTRPLGVHPDLWKIISARQKEELQATWKDVEPSWAEKNSAVKAMLESKQKRSKKTEKAAAVMPVGISGLNVDLQPTTDDSMSGAETAAPSVWSDA